MSQRINSNVKKRRRLITLAWVAALAITTVLLIWKEQTAILYILATLGVTGVLIVVALSDLGGKTPTTSE